LLREGPSYTVDTVAALLEGSPDDELFLIVGSDTYPELRHWRDPERLFELCTVAVVARPGSASPAGGGDEAVTLVAGAGLEISATAIRGAVAQGESVRYLVPSSVAEYIAKRGLYR
jgi:nicotinate-nucleotide adenylyltransferase